jgi:tetratricopeptide (TPR) repeat protein
VNRVPLHPDVQTGQDGVAWLEEERVNLHAAVARAARDHPAYAVAIPGAMHGYLRHHGPWDQVLALHRIALDTARRLSERNAEASALTDLGDTHYVNSNYPAAMASLTEALTLYRDLGSRHGEAYASAILGYVEHLAGDDSRAAARMASALNTFRDLGDRLGEASTLAYLGSMHTANGDYLAAIAAFTPALEIGHDQGITIVEARLHNFLGVATARDRRLP